MRTTLCSMGGQVLGSLVLEYLFDLASFCDFYLQNHFWKITGIRARLAHTRIEDQGILEFSMLYLIYQEYTPMSSICCFNCKKNVTQDVPDAIIFRAIAICPECLEQEDDIIKECMVAAGASADDNRREEECRIYGGNPSEYILAQFSKIPKNSDGKPIFIGDSVNFDDGKTGTVIGITLGDDNHYDIIVQCGHINITVTNEDCYE